MRACITHLESHSRRKLDEPSHPRKLRASSPDLQLEAHFGQWESETEARRVQSYQNTDETFPGGQQAYQGR